MERIQASGPLMATTFKNPEVVKAFVQKYKGITVTFQGSAAAGYETYDLFSDAFNHDQKLVHDFGAKKEFIIFAPACYMYFRQLAGFCGGVWLYGSHYPSVAEKTREFIEELLYCMGYNMICHSSAHIESMTAAGFKPFLQVVNRRTARDIILYYKSLVK